jgi:hypothetical protein
MQRQNSIEGKLARGYCSPINVSTVAIVVQEDQLAYHVRATVHSMKCLKWFKIYVIVPGVRNNCSA